MLPILLCLGGWGWSSTHISDLTYHFHGDRAWDVCAGDGAIDFGYGWASFGRGWEYQDIRYDEMDPFYKMNWQHMLIGRGEWAGFSYSDISEMGGNGMEELITVPYWSLFVFFTVAFCIVCRKTRGKVRGPSAFPVEVGAGTNSKQTG